MPFLDAANNLSRMASIAGIDLTTCMPKSYSINKRKIKGVLLKYTDIELLEYLKDAGVISVGRHVAYAPQLNGNRRELHNRS